MGYKFLHASGMRSLSTCVFTLHRHFAGGPFFSGSKPCTFAYDVVDKPVCPVMEETQTHVHEFLGRTMLASENNETHNHRFSGVTSEVMLV